MRSILRICLFLLLMVQCVCAGAEYADVKFSVLSMAPEGYYNKKISSSEAASCCRSSAEEGMLPWGYPCPPNSAGVILRCECQRRTWFRWLRGRLHPQVSQANERQLVQGCRVLL